jgi:multicomponent Na+:H+ antiporter subunit D
MSVLEQLPALPVIIPLVAAPLAVLLPRRLMNGRLPWAWATLVSWVAFACCASLLVSVANGGPISYHMGDWAPPIGIEYRIDIANALVLTLVSGVAALAFPYSFESIRGEIDERQLPMFYGMALISMVGLLGVAIAGDAFNVFVFVEISSLSTYALVALGAGRDRRALTAAFNYLVMGTIGATFFVIGLGLLYQATGTLNMADLRIQLAGKDSAMIEAGFAFILVGMGLKAAMFPMHLWMPNAYAYAPSSVSVFLAATSTKVAVYVIIRFIYTVIGADFDFAGAAFTWLLTPLAIAGMFFASIVAIFQDDLKRMLAYSSVGQIGYMLLGISFGTEQGLSATLVHLLNHGLMKGALFMAAGCVVLRLGAQSCAGYAGLAQRMPLTAAAFIVAGLSLVGVPGTAGFISKWQLLTAAFDSGRVWAGLLVVASSLLAVIYVGRVVELMVARPAPAGPIAEAPASMLIPMWILAAANIYFGLNTELTVDLAERAATALMGDAR